MLVADTMTVALLWEHRVAFTWKVLRATPPFAGRSVLFVLMGVALGTLLLSRVPAAAGRLALAAVLLAFVVSQAHRLTTRDTGAGRPPTIGASIRIPPAAPIPLAIAGFAGGVLDGWLGTGGVAIAAYLAWRRFPPSAFVTALRGYFLATDAVRALSYGVAGYWTHATLALYLTMLPIAVPGLVLGVVLRRRLATPTVFTAVVLLVLAGYAIAVAARALSGP